MRKVLVALLLLLLSRSSANAQDAARRIISPELQRMGRVYHHLMEGAPIKLWACGPEDANHPACQGNVPLNSSNAWATQINGTKLIVFTKKGIHNLQSDDEVACVMAHEAGHAFSPNQIPYTTFENRKFDEQDADKYSIPLIMLAGYDARACLIAQEHINAWTSRPIPRPPASSPHAADDRLESDLPTPHN